MAKKLVKNYALFILLFGLLGMAKSITEHKDWFAGLKYVTFPRRAWLFFFCTQVQGTPKRPVEIFIVGTHSNLGSLHRKSSKKKIEMSTSSLSKE